MCKRPRPLRRAGKPLPVARVLLVPSLLRSNRNAYEQDWPQKTVLISLAVTTVSLIFPITGSGYYTMLLSFSLLGIGNAIMQTSLNPLVTNLISEDKLASTLTFGQFVKAIASFLAPILAARGIPLTSPHSGWAGERSS